MLLLAAGNVLYGVVAVVAVGNLLTGDDEDPEEEDHNDLLQMGIYACRVWFIGTVVVGVLAARGVLQVSLCALRVQR